MRLRPPLFVLIFVVSMLPGLAQAACADLASKQFDFWIGDWNVSSANGQLLGRNRVEKLYEGCVLQEHWTGVKGGTGSSFNVYDSARKVWHQTWVDSTGSLLVLEGGLKEGSMVLSGEQVQQDGKRLLNRITWTPKDGTVRQHWESSSDGGKTWTTVFDGLYRKAG